MLWEKWNTALENLKGGTGMGGTTLDWMVWEGLCRVENAG